MIDMSNLAIWVNFERFLILKFAFNTNHLPNEQLLLDRFLDYKFKKRQSRVNTSTITNSRKNREGKINSKISKKRVPTYD